MPDPTLAILDLDGTLVDLHDAVDFDAMLVDALRACGGEVPPAAVRETLWAEGRHHDAWLRARGVADVSRFWARFDELDAAARAAAIEKGTITAFPDAHGLVDRLRGAGTVLAVLTNAPATLASMEMRAFGLDTFDVVIGLGVDGHDQFTAKPEPDGIFLAQRLAAVKTGRDHALATVMIGDSAIDMLAARAAGVPGILVARQEHPGTPPPGTSLVVQSLDELDAGVLASTIDRFNR